jgi:putative FmdB family regulatory protein
MPLFEYRCAACGKKTEELVLAGDTATRPTCSSCGSSNLTRLLSVFAAHGSHHSDAGSGLGACGEGACPTPDACGTGACGMDGGYGGFGDDY